MSRTLPTPTRDEFTSASETLVYVNPGQKPDTFNRVQFTAFWQTDQEWVPGGVRGQVFHSDLSQFTARVEARKGTVRVLPDADLGDVA